MPRRLLIPLAVLLAAGGCTRDATPRVAASPAVPAPAVTSAAPVAPGRVVDAAGDRLTVTMTPLVRSGDAVVMTLQVRVDRAADGSAAVSRLFGTAVTTNSADAARLIDETGRRVWEVAEKPDGGCVCTGLLRVEDGATQPVQAAFTGVGPEVGTLSVMLPYAGVFTDVPVVSGTVPPPPTGKTLFGRPYEPLDPAGATSLAADLDSWTERLGTGVQTRRTRRGTDISLDADVLFRLDSAELTPAAARSLDAAVADLRGKTPGPLVVTGHTDDTGTPRHNQELSEQRARTVADALERDLPQATWPRTVSGRGESRPAVPNTGAANRKLNRRVTIAYADRPGAGATAAAPATAVPLPATSGKTGRTVELDLPLRRGTVRFSAGEARVRGPFLLVELRADSVGNEDAVLLDTLGQKIFTVRGEFDPYARYSASGVRLLTGGTAAYGLDYLLRPGSHQCLCDRLLNRRIPAGSSQTLSLWFPAPPPGTATVTLDVPDRFRITDIPII